MSSVSNNQAEPKAFAKPDLIQQMRKLGLASGDTVLVRVLPPRVAFAKISARVFVESVLEAVGKKGTILALTHSRVQTIFKRDPSYVYEPATAPSITGRFADTVLKWDGAFRSLHPTCSMAAIGPRARDLLGEHDHTSTCFGPIKNLIQVQGKMLLVGNTVKSPGFSTVHYVYEHIGLAHRSLLSGLLGCYFRRGTSTRWFCQRDVPGCSMGYHKFYQRYQERGVLRTGSVGAGEAFLIRAADAFAVEKELIEQDPRYSLCDDPHCFSCRATKLFNLRDMPAYYLKNGPRLVLRLLGKGLAA